MHSLVRLQFVAVRHQLELAAREVGVHFASQQILLEMRGPFVVLSEAQIGK